MSHTAVFSHGDISLQAISEERNEPDAPRGIKKAITERDSSLSLRQA